MEFICDNGNFQLSGSYILKPKRLNHSRLVLKIYNPGTHKFPSIYINTNSSDREKMPIFVDT